MSHHGNNAPPVPPEFVKLLQKELQGEFPDGRLNHNDEGAIVVSIGHENGKIIIQFPSAVTWIGFTPEQALEIAQLLIVHAKQVGVTSPFELKL